MRGRRLTELEDNNRPAFNLAGESGNKPINKPLRNAVMKRVSKVLKKLGMRQLSDEEAVRVLRS